MPQICVRLETEDLAVLKELANKMALGHTTYASSLLTRAIRSERDANSLEAQLSNKRQAMRELIQ